jgi:hypothetical protein
MFKSRIRGDAFFAWGNASGMSVQSDRYSPTGSWRPLPKGIRGLSRLDSAERYFYLFSACKFIVITVSEVGF